MPNERVQADNWTKPSILTRRMLCGHAEILFVFAYNTRDRSNPNPSATATQYQLQLKETQTMSHQALPSDQPTQTPNASVWGASITIGFGAAVIMWMVAWILHMPGVHVPNSIAIPILLLPLLLISILWLPNLAPSARIKAGSISGLIAGLVNLLILGSNIVEQPETTAQMGEQANALAPNAALIVVGSLVISIAIGAIAGLIVSKKDNGAGSIQIASTWRSRFAWITALTYLPLIAVGGVVTTTDSGLAVPDAVTSYGAISVLFPIKLMAEPRIFFEHSHRLFGTLAGFTTLVLMIRVLASEPRKLPKMLSIVLFIAVALQGYMGIIRVADQSSFFAIIHGVFAQLVFALALVTAIILSNSWNFAAPSDETIAIAKRTRTMMLLTFIALVIQLCLGAVTRHLNSGHAMRTHLGFAFIVVILVIIGGALCMRTGKVDQTGKSIRPFGMILHGVVILQFTLGFAVLGLAWEGEDAPAIKAAADLADAPPIETIPTLVTTAHHIIGALVLASAAGALVWAIKLASSRKTQ